MCHVENHARASNLTSWKDIARYMGKGIRTVQRWEQDFGLPVHRPEGATKRAILARPSEIDAWIESRCGTRSGSNTEQIKTSLAARLRFITGMETSRALHQNTLALTSELQVAPSALTMRVAIATRIQSGSVAGTPNDEVDKALPRGSRLIAAENELE